MVVVSMPTCDAPDARRTMLLAAVGPLKVGVLSLVMLSVELMPVSLAAARSGAAVGAAGAIVSSVTFRTGEGGAGQAAGWI